MNFKETRTVCHCNSAFPLYDTSLIAYTTDVACLSVFFGGSLKLCVVDTAALYVNLFSISLHGLPEPCRSRIRSSGMCVPGSTSLPEFKDIAFCNSASGSSDLHCFVCALPCSCLQMRSVGLLYTTDRNFHRPHPIRFALLKNSIDTQI